MVWQLAASVAFGVLPERATIKQLRAYEYGQFLIMFGEVPLTFGVGWFWVVSSFSSGVRFLAYGDGWIGRWLAPVAGIDAVLGTALALVVVAKPQVDRSSLPRVAAWVPLEFHFYFLIIGVLSRVFKQKPFLLFVMLS